MRSRELIDNLPHKDPFLLLDDVVEVAEDGTSITCIYKVKGVEKFLEGHFPGNPIMPGNLIVEAICQTGACLISQRSGYEDKLGLLAGVDGFRFHRLVRPGDVITLHAQVERLRERAGVMFGKAQVGTEHVTQGKVLFIIAPRDI